VVGQVIVPTLAGNRFPRLEVWFEMILCPYQQRQRERGVPTQ
jgi:hypothetical protein